MGVSYGKLMMWFFLLSDAFTFSALLITYGLVRSSHLGYDGAVEDFVFSQTYWPIPEKVFEAIPFFDVHAPLVFVGYGLEDKRLGLDDYRGLSKRRPGLALVFTVFLLAQAGVEDVNSSFVLRTVKAFRGLPVAAG